MANKPPKTADLRSGVVRIDTILIVSLLSDDGFNVSASLFDDWDECRRRVVKDGQMGRERRSERKKAARIEDQNESRRKMGRSRMSSSNVRAGAWMRIMEPDGARSIYMVGRIGD